MKPARALPLIDLEGHVPRAITVVRRSQGWPGFFLHERRGEAGVANYLGGPRQHVFYYFPQPLVQDVTVGSVTKTVRYAAGEARFTPAASPVLFRWQKSVQVYILGFEPWYLERVATELNTPLQLTPEMNFRKLPAEHPATLLVRQMAAEIDTGRSGAFLADSLARATAVHLLRSYLELPPPRPQAVAPPAAVLRAVALMRAKLAEAVSLDELARTAGLSPFHFSRQFKAATGYPPHEYHIRLRMDRALELLRTRGREWSLAAIATECGFVDQSHFSRHFKRVVGVTPGEYLG